MKEITYHDRSYLRQNNLVMSVNEKKVQFINGIAAVHATVRSEYDTDTYSGIINEEYQEVFDDDEQYGDACRYLMFLGYNTKILRSGENDFIVTVRVGDEYHSYYLNRHVRIEDGKAVLVNEDIGKYYKTNLENILIIGGRYDVHDKKLYNITKGKHICGGYDEISVIEGRPDYFAVKKSITSLTKDSPKDEDLYLTDELYFQIDQNGHIVSKVFSQRKLDFLDYGDVSLDEYPMYRKKELIEESQKLKENVYSLRRTKN